jgi:hypothetical protein
MTWMLFEYAVNSSASTREGLRAMYFVFVVCLASRHRRQTRDGGWQPRGSSQTSHLPCCCRCSTCLSAGCKPLLGSLCVTPAMCALLFLAAGRISSCFVSSTPVVLWMQAAVLYGVPFHGIWLGSGQAFGSGGCHTVDSNSLNA